MITVSAIPYELVDDVWPIVENWLDKAAKVTEGFFDLDAIRETIEQGHLALWMVLEDDTPVACFTTRLTDYPGGRVLYIDWIGGRKMTGWIEKMDEVICQYGRDNQCQRIEGFGREGWTKVLKPMGYNRVPMYRKEL